MREALPDQHPFEAEKTNSSDASLSSLGQGQVQPSSDGQPEPPGTRQRYLEQDRRPTNKTLWREIRIIDVVNCLVGISMLIVAIAAYRVASDTSDIKTAISNLSKLADQTKRQADSMADQLSAVRDQVAALKQQAAEIKLQTQAISQQTAAIKASSDANIKSAQAQQTLAEISAQAQKPDVDLMELTLSGLNSEPDKAGVVTAVLFWRFRNIGGSALSVEDVRFGVMIGGALPEKMPEGTVFNGSGLVVINSINSAFAPKDPIKLSIPKAQADSMMNGSEKVFFFARFEYWDSQHNEHARCFGRQFLLKEGNSYFTTPSGGAAYQCAN